MCEGCCNCFIFSFYLIILLTGSLLTIVITMCTPFSFPDNSIFKDDKVLIDKEYHHITDFPDLYQIYRNYSNDIYYQRKYDFSLSYNIAVIPIISILSIIFSANFICCKYDKILFFVFGFFNILLHLTPLLNKIYSNKQKKNLPELEELENDFDEIYRAYEDYRNILSKNIYILLLILLGIQFIIFICLVIIKKADSSKDNNNNYNKKCARCSILFYSTFGIASTSIFIISTYFFYPCKNRYSDNFLSDKYSFTKIETINISKYYSKNITYSIEEYDYKDYPYLKEIYNIYYSNMSKKKIKVNVDYENLGIIYFFLAVAGTPVLVIISFILLLCFKCNEKGHIGFIIFEILSILLKSCIIIWPFIWVKNKYRKNMINTNEEIKYLIDDYLNFSKCRNEFPIIIIIEYAYIFFEIIIFLASFAGNSRDNEKDENRPAPLAITEGENQQSQPQKSENTKIIYVEREKIIRQEVEHKHVKLKFKDNKNHQYELDVDVKRRFIDVLYELIGKNEYLKKNDIESVLLGDRFLYLKHIQIVKNRSLETIEQLNIDDNTGFIIIKVFESQQNNVTNSQKLETSNLNKSKLPPLLKLHFCLINLDSRKIDIVWEKDSIFSEALDNLRKNDKELSDVIFESIFYYNRGEKIKIEGESLNKKIIQLAIPKDEIIFIKTNYKDNTPIKLKFIWVNGKNNQIYDHQGGKKEKFHSVAIDFMGKNKEFINNYIITKFYTYQSNNNQYAETIYSRENLEITENPIIDIIETELKCNIQKLEELGLQDGSEIFFETRPNLSVNLIQNSMFFTNYLYFSTFTKLGNKILKFRTTTGQELLFTVNENEKFEEVIFRLKEANVILKDIEIKSALLKGCDLLKEEKKNSKIKDLDIDDNDVILLAIEI